MSGKENEDTPGGDLSVRRSCSLDVGSPEKKKRRALLDASEPALRELCKRRISYNALPENKRRGEASSRGSAAENESEPSDEAVGTANEAQPRVPCEGEPAASEEAFAAVVASADHLSLRQNTTEKAAPNMAERIYLALRLHIAFDREPGSRTALKILVSSARGVSATRAENPSISDWLTSQLGPLPPLDAEAVADVLGRRRVTTVNSHSRVLLSLRGSDSSSGRRTVRVLQALHEALQLEKAHSAEMGQVLEVARAAQPSPASSAPVVRKPGAATAGSPVSARLAAQQLAAKESEFESERAAAAAQLATRESEFESERAAAAAQTIASSASLAATRATLESVRRASAQQLVETCAKLAAMRSRRDFATSSAEELSVQLGKARSALESVKGALAKANSLRRLETESRQQLVAPRVAAATERAREALF